MSTQTTSVLTGPTAASNPSPLVESLRDRLSASEALVDRLTTDLEIAEANVARARQGCQRLSKELSEYKASVWPNFARLSNQLNRDIALLDQEAAKQACLRWEMCQRLREMVDSLDLPQDAHDQLYDLANRFDPVINVAEHLEEP